MYRTVAFHKSSSGPSNSNATGRLSYLLSLSLLLLCLSCSIAQAQGTQTLYGDFKVDDSKAEPSTKPINYDLILYFDTGTIAGRQTISNGGRYRFVNMPNGVYFLAVELENTEITRIRVELLRSNYKADYRQDVELTYRSNPAASRNNKSVNVNVEDFYSRSPQSQKKFEKAQVAADSQKYAEAVTAFKSLVTDDPKDFQAWTELGTVYLAQKNFPEAENAYVQATTVKPGFFLPLLNLGRLRVLQNNFDGAITVLLQALESKPDSAAANYYLGEAYLQTKKGSKAVIYLTEAGRLGKADAHLRLATLYNAVNMKDKAASEYEEYLKKQPDSPDRKKMEAYIQANKAGATKP